MCLCCVGRDWVDTYIILVFNFNDYLLKYLKALSSMLISLLLSLKYTQHGQTDCDSLKHVHTSSIYSSHQFYLQLTPVLFIAHTVLLSANEIVLAAHSEADKIQVASEADREKVVQNSYITAYKGLFSKLNVTTEEHQLSLLMIRTLEDSVDNLVAGYGYYKHTLYAPQYKTNYKSGHSV